MHTTSESLLVKLCGPGAKAPAWERFVKLYTPLLFYWAHKQGLQDSDAADLVQEVLTLLVQKLPLFEYDKAKSFRDWLRIVLLNKWRDRLRKRSATPVESEVLDGLADEPVAGFEEEEYRRHLSRRALELMQAEFSVKTWKACWEHVVGGRKAADVARELGISEGSVYVAKARVLARLRIELQDLLD